MSVETGDVPLIEVWRGGLPDLIHRGHAVICDGTGQIVAAWGNPDAVAFPRSAFKMIQALPLLESGAARAHGLTDKQLALACASHFGAPYHTEAVSDWLAQIGRAEADLRCGAHEPGDRAGRDALIRAGQAPCQIHNNCSGKHTGFLTVARHLGAGPEYLADDHPVQRAVTEAFEEVTGAPVAARGIDGCSAPTLGTTMVAMARGMARFATAQRRSGVRATAQQALIAAMIAQPHMVSAEGKPCTDLMRACAGRVAVKGGADGYYVAMIPDMGLGLALKISDGGERAKDAAIAALLIRLGVLEAGHPAAQRLVGGPVRNWRGLVVGQVRAAPGVLA